MLTPDELNAARTRYGVPPPVTPNTPKTGNSLLSDIMSPTKSSSSDGSSDGGFLGSPVSGESPYAPKEMLDTKLSGVNKALLSPTMPYKGNETQNDLVAGAAVNLPTSAIRNFEMIANPETYKGLTRAVAGAVQSIPGIGKLLKTPDFFVEGSGEEADAKNKEAFQGLLTGLHNQYGSVENIKRSIKEDPVGTLLAAEGLLRAGTAGLNAAGRLSTPAAEVALKASEAAAGTGRLAKGAGEVAYESAITPNAKEAPRILKYEAKTPLLERVTQTFTGEEPKGKPLTRARTAMEQGIMGRERDIGVKSKRASETIWKDEIQPRLKESTVRITKGDLFAPIEERIAGTMEPGKKAAFEAAYEAIKEDYKNSSDFSLEDAQKVKSELDKFTPDKVFRGQPIASEYGTLKNDMANAIRKKIYDSITDTNIKKKYLDYGNLKELERIGVKAITGATKKGGFGTFWSGVWDAATTPVKTVAGQVLYRVGDKLEFLGEKGVTTFGDFLESRGLKRPSRSDLPIGE